MSRDYYGSLAGQKHWFIGVVKDVNDPNNRVRVQIKGLHPENAGSSTTVQTASLSPGGGISSSGQAATGSASPQALVSVSKDDLPTSTQLSAPLSAHFTLGSLIKDNHRAFLNQLTPTIIYNLKNLSVNCLEPLKAQFPGMVINSGWRHNGGRNQSANHFNGYAVDFAVPGQTPASICNWIQQNLKGRYNLLEQATRHVHIQLGGTSRQGSLSSPIKVYGPSKS